jgi:hypothetical protein
MNNKELTELTDQELLIKRKDAKSTDVINAVFFGIVLGIAIYSTVKNGYGLMTFIPLLFAPIAAKHSRYKKAIEQEVKNRHSS